MKKTMAIVIAVAMLALLTGCATSSGGKYTMRKSSHSMNSGGVMASYASFSGNRHYTKTLEAGAKITVSVTTDSGEMHLTVTGPDQTLLLETDEAGTHEATAQEKGKYTVEFSSEQHSGGYTIAW